MRRTIIALTFLVTVTVLLFIIIQTVDPLARQEREMALWRADAQATRLQTFDDVLYAGLRLAPLGLLVLAFGAGIIAIAIAWNRYGRKESVASAFIIEAIRAQKHLPATVQALAQPSAPSMRTPTRILAVEDDEEDEQDEQDGEAPAAPSMTELLEFRQVGDGIDLILGFDHGKAITGDWTDLYSTGVCGASGSGKTNMASFLLAQSLLHRGKVMVLDPHANAKESLASTIEPLIPFLGCEPADGGHAALQTVLMVHDELNTRLHSKQRAYTPLILAIDEWTALMRGDLAEPLSALLEAIAQEGRKTWVFAFLMGQIWTASRAGGTELRDALTSAYVLRSKPRQARMLTGETANEQPGDISKLPRGTGYLYRVDGTRERITIPHTTTADMLHVAPLLTDDAATMPRIHSQPAATSHDEWLRSSLEADVKPSVSGNEATRHVTSSASLSPEAARAYELLLGGMDIPQIALEMGFTKSTSGGAAQQANKKVHALIREVGHYYQSIPVAA